MARLRIRVELSRGGQGVPLHKLSGVIEEARKFFELLSEDVHIDVRQGEWLGVDFDRDSLNFTAEYVGPVSADQVSAFHAAFAGTTSLRRGTIAQFARITDAIGEEELVGFGLYQSEEINEPTEWRCLSRRDALQITEEIKYLAETSEPFEGDSHLPAVRDPDLGARLFGDRRDRALEHSKWTDYVREVESTLSSRLTRVENTVQKHSGLIGDLRTQAASTEESFRGLLSAVESFCNQAAAQIERIPGLPAPAARAAAAGAPLVEAPSANFAGASAPPGAAPPSAVPPEDADWSPQHGSLPPAAFSAAPAVEAYSPSSPFMEHAAEEVAEPFAQHTVEPLAEPFASPAHEPELVSGAPLASSAVASEQAANAPASTPARSAQAVLNPLFESSDFKPPFATPFEAARKPAAPRNASGRGAGGVLQRLARPENSLLVAATAAVACVVVVVGTWMLWPSHSSPSLNQNVSAQAPVTADAAAAAKPSGPPSTAAAPAPNAPTTSAVAKLAASDMQLDLEATEPVWVSLTDTAGNRMFAQLLVPGTPRSVTIPKAATLRVGNAGGLSARLNGKPIGSVGAHGKVADVLFKDGSFKVVPGA